MSSTGGLRRRCGRDADAAPTAPARPGSKVHTPAPPRGAGQCPSNAGRAPMDPGAMEGNSFPAPTPQPPRLSVGRSDSVEGNRKDRQSLGASPEARSDSSPRLCNRVPGHLLVPVSFGNRVSRTEQEIKSTILVHRLTHIHTASRTARAGEKLSARRRRQSERRNRDAYAPIRPSAAHECASRIARTTAVMSVVDVSAGVLQIKTCGLEAESVHTRCGRVLVGPAWMAPLTARPTLHRRCIKHLWRCRPCTGGASAPAAAA